MEIKKESRPLLGAKKRWRILKRDGFICAYCGSKPGNAELHIDHLIPYARGGSDHENNLITACDRCNLGKGNRVAIPQNMMDGSVDYQSWITWKTFGPWSLKVSPEMDAAAATIGIGLGEYWIDILRCHEPDWQSHMDDKLWFTPEMSAGLCDILEFMRSIIRND